MYIDPGTGLVARVVATRDVHTMVTTNSEWRVIGGRKVATRAVQSVVGMPANTVTQALDTLRVNVEVPSSRFAPPDEQPAAMRWLRKEGVAQLPFEYRGRHVWVRGSIDGGPPADFGPVGGLLKKIKNTLIHEGDMFGIVSTGTSSIAVDLTYDAKRIDEAIGKVMGGALKPSDIIQAPEGNEGPSEVRYRAHTAFATAEDLMGQLEQVHNRRKAMIYLSNGYDFNPFEKARSGTADSVFENNQQKLNDKQQRDLAAQQAGENPNNAVSADTPGSRFADADLARELSELTRSANRANATIYTFDPRGLVGMPDLDEKVDPSEWANYVEKSINSLRVLAELTGGIAVVNQNDYEKALKRIDAETSDYYMLGYYSSNPDPLRRTRRVEVKVARKDLDVWSRQTYTLKKPPAPKVPK
jgi:VWFA-related protein